MVCFECSHMVIKMKTNRIALSAALLASTTLVPVAAFAQDEQIEDQITVRYQYIPDDRRVTSEVSAVLSLDDLETTGDSDLASALVRVTGISTTGGRFAVVRGLNERYSNTLLNGSPMPSPEPLRRAAPLDIFPTNVLSNVLVQKTATPQFPAEFGGGVIAIETATLPNEGFFSVSVGGGFDTETTGQDGLTYDGSDTDWLGMDDGLRDIPGPIAALWDTTNFAGSQLSRAQKAELGASFVNSELWVLQTVDTDANGDFSVSAGNRFDFDNFSIGLLGAANYSNSWQTREGTRGDVGTNGYVAGPLDFATFTNAVDETNLYNNTTATENVIDASAMFSAGIDFYNDHEISFLSMVLRSTSKETRRTQRWDNPSEIANQIDSLSWFEREVVFNQLKGEHTFEDMGGLGVEWRISDATATRDAPYEREYRYEYDRSGNLTYNPTITSSNFTRFSTVEDETSDAGVDFELPVTVGNYDVELSAGFAQMSREREAAQRTFRFRADSDSYVRDIEDSRIDYLFAAQNFNTEGFYLDEANSTDSSPQRYDAVLETEAFYGGVDVELNAFLRAAVGVRFEEETDFNVRTFAVPGGLLFDRDVAIDDLVASTTGAENAIYSELLDQDYTLPSATLTWTFADNLQLRTGYSQSIARPQFREIAAAEFVDLVTDNSYIGNPFLRNTEIESFDARLEYYFGREQFVTLGLFHKTLENPIEERIRPVGDTIFYDYINAPEATLQGYEIEFEKTFDLSNRFNNAFFADREWFIKTNYTNISSEVSVDSSDVVIVNNGTLRGPVASITSAETVIRDGRELQGQSEHLFNLQLGYEAFDGRSRAALLYNYTSERIRSAELLTFDSVANEVVVALPSIIEQVPSSLDFVYSRTIEVADADWDLGFSVRNILGDDYEATALATTAEVELPVDTYDVGTSFGFSISRTW